MTDAQSSLRLLLDNAAPYHEALEHHLLYQEVTSLTRIRCFLEHHVFAVWDFMSLIKSLQRHLTRVEAPWLPVGDARIRRLINGRSGRGIGCATGASSARIQAMQAKDIRSPQRCGSSPSLK